MRKEVVVFAGIMALTAAAARFLPGFLGLPSGLVQEMIMLALAPVLLIFVRWARRPS